MSFLRRLLGGGREETPAAAEPSGAPAEPVTVDDPNATLAEHVGRLLARPELEYLIVEWDAARRLYVRFTPSPDGLVAEAVGDRYLEPRHRLSSAQRSRLEALGWSEAPESGNLERRWPAGAEPEAVANVCVETMEVYGMQPRPQWTITFGAD